MIQEVSQDFFHEAGTMPWFPQAVVHDEGLAEQLNLLFDLLLQPKNTLFKQSLYISTLAYLLSRYNQSKKILKDLPQAQRKVVLVQENDLLQNLKESINWLQLQLLSSG